jgi:hypothetical protein
VLIALAIWGRLLQSEDKKEFSIEIIGSIEDIDEATVAVANLIILF